jgi:urease accessory protein UreF
MIRPATVLQGAKAKLAGDLDGLLEQIGSPEGDFSVSRFTEAHEIRTSEDLRTFLGKYQSEFLTTIELPAIVQAYNHVTRNECRELIALDKSFNAAGRLNGFASASERIGRFHLERLRPMRDNRFVQRYLSAIDTKEAHGWHTLVYGLTLAVYSMPLRQGLIAYGEQTLNGFALCGARHLNLSEKSGEEMSFHFSQLLPAKIDTLVSPANFLCK